MASGRVVHKSLYESEDLMDLSIKVRYLYIGTIIHADDDGRMKANPKLLKKLIFPYDDELRSQTIKEWRDELVNEGSIIIYVVDGIEYLYHPHWKKWQTIRKDRYQLSRYPTPSEGKIPFLAAGPADVTPTAQHQKISPLEDKISLKADDTGDRVANVSQVVNPMATTGQPSDNQAVTNGQPKVASNSTKLNLTELNLKSQAEPGPSADFTNFPSSLKEKLAEVNRSGLNIHALINQFLAESKLSIKLPEDVLLILVETILSDKYKPRRAWPYFKKSLKNAAEKHCISLQKIQAKTGKCNEEGIKKLKILINSIII